jgi:uncharacterized protein (DUF488 family)
MSKIHSIGYANLKREDFLSVLKNNGITALADVRSLPYSKRFNEYNKEDFSSFLRLNGISYVYLGLELGPRSRDHSHYDQAGQVQFELLNKTDIFLSGIERIEKGLKKGFSIAMMCAEKMPETCHRSLLISEFLFNEKKIETSHIHHDSSVELHSSMRERLVKGLGIQEDIFMSKDEVELQAVSVFIKKHAYRKNNEPAPSIK